MTPEFYRKYICPKDKLSLRLLELDIHEVRGKYEVWYRVFWPCETLQKAKARIKIWAAKERVEALSIAEVKQQWKDTPEERSI